MPLGDADGTHAVHATGYHQKRFTSQKRGAWEAAHVPASQDKVVIVLLAGVILAFRPIRVLVLIAARIHMCHLCRPPCC